MSGQAETLAYYANQGLTSNPGELVPLLDVFPDHPEGICRAVQNYALNDFLCQAGNFKLPQGFEADMELRSVRERLKTVARRKAAASGADCEAWSMGNCRDICLLICAVLRQKGVPARLRSGFATFFDPNLRHDHWVCEYWTGQAWQRIDGWMEQVERNIERIPPEFGGHFANLGMNTLDVAPQFYLTGGRAWQMCRSRQAGFESFGTSQPELKGEWFVRDNMIRDLFCLIKLEPLPWDIWGGMTRSNSHSPAEYELYDQIAALTQEPFTDVQALLSLGARLGCFELPAIWGLSANNG